jgi:hypothetical protein
MTHSKSVTLTYVSFEMMARSRKVSARRYAGVSDNCLAVFDSSVGDAPDAAASEAAAEGISEVLESEGARWASN